MKKLKINISPIDSLISKISKINEMIGIISNSLNELEKLNECSWLGKKFEKNPLNYLEFDIYKALENQISDLENDKIREQKELCLLLKIKL